IMLLTSNIQIVQVVASMDWPEITKYRGLPPGFRRRRRRSPSPATVFKGIIRHADCTLI
ncbi:hypothetical protein ACJX0J_018390, partial [Zea mays]